MSTISVRRLGRWTQASLTALALAGMTAARPAQAQDSGLPVISGFSFDLSFAGDSTGTAALFVTSQDTTGAFTGYIQRGSAANPVSGMIAPILATSPEGWMVIARPGGLVIIVGNGHAQAGGFWVSIDEPLSTESQRHYEGELTVSGSTGAIWGFAYRLRSRTIAVLGNSFTYFTIEDFSSFTATGHKP